MKNKMASALKAAHDRYQASHSALEKITAVLGAKSVPQLSTEAVDSARFQLEECMARRALDEASDVEVTEARRALASAEKQLADLKAKYADEHSAVQLESSGLNRRLQKAQQEEATAANALREAQTAWLYEELRMADEAYVKAAIAARDAYVRVFVCRDVLRLRGKEQTNNIITLAPPLTIPLIGPESCAATEVINANSMNVVRDQLLVRANRSEGASDEVVKLQVELQDAATGIGGMVGRMVKTVSGNVTEAVSETVSRLSGR